MIETDTLPWNEQAKACWAMFVQQKQLSEFQQHQCKQYINALLEWNKTTNLTRITALADIIQFHLQDSMRVDAHAAFKAGQTVCDVGSGAGFPGIPLAIKRPDLQYVLVEVNQKKTAFLRHCIQLLQLSAYVQVVEYDWRTLLRQAPMPIDWFLARASLQLDELVRVFKPACTYHNAQLIYWASDQWHVEDAERAFFVKKEAYTVGSVRRWYAFFARNDGKK